MSTPDVALSRRSRTGFTAAGLAILAVAAAVVLFALNPPQAKARHFTASFGRAGQGLDTRSTVVVRGVTVGRVTGVGLDARGRAVVRMRVDRDVRIPRTASASIEPLSVFGPKDVVLDLGAGEGTGPYLPDHAAITRTTDPAELADAGPPLDKLTSAIDPDELYTVIHTFAGALRGNGERLRRTTGNASTLLGIATDHPGDTAQMINDLASLTGTLDDHARAVTATGHDLNGLLPAITDDPAALGRTLDGISAVSDQAIALLRNDAPALRRLIDSGSALSTTLFRHRDELVPLLQALNGLFGTLAGVVRLPGPNGTAMGAVDDYISLDPCDLLTDICKPSGNANANAPGKPAASGTGAGG